LTLLSLIGVAAQCLISAFVLSGALSASRCVALFISFVISLGVAGIVPGGKTKE
jgi:hypothetical protein